MPPGMDDIRHQLVVLARRKQARTLGWPRDWRPTQVLDPQSEKPFTPEGAWGYIADLLEQGEPIETKILDPPEEGDTAYVMKVPHRARAHSTSNCSLGADL